MQRPFMEKANKPTEQEIQLALGNAYAFYTRAIELADTFAQTWTFTKSSGWMLKVHDRQKALFYAIPLYEELRFSLTLRELERDTLLQDDDLAAMRGAIASARKFSEGFALQFDIAREDDYRPFALFIRKLIAERG